MVRRPLVAILGGLMLIAALGPPLASGAEAAAPAGPAPEWRRDFGTGLRDVAVDPSGDVYVTGFKRYPERGMVIRKYSSGGERIWTRSWTPNDAWSMGTDLAIGSDGSVYLAGGMGPEGMEGGAWFIRTFSPDGDLLWRRATPHWRDGAVTAISGIAVGGGLVVASGYEHGCCGESFWHDGWVRAYDTDGALRWVRDFEPPGLRRTIDAANDVAVGEDGSAFVVGWVARRHQLESDRSDPERTEHDIVLQELDRDGRVVWTNVLDDRQRHDFDEARAVDLVGGRLAVTGTAWSSNRSGDAWLGAFSTSGGLVWQRVWAKRNARDAYPLAVSLDPSGVAYVTGYRIDHHGEDLFLRRFETAGTLGWESLLEDRDHMTGFGVDAVAGGSVFVAGSGIDGFDEKDADGFLWLLEA